MADHNITISNSLNTFGLAPSNKWNDWNWNAFLWGEGTEDMQVLVQKLIEEAVTFDSAVTTQFSVYVIISNSLTPDADMYAESLTDGSGYNYVFASNTTDGEGRTFPTYTAVTDGSGTWTAATAATTTWS